MHTENLYQDIAARTKGEIYIGVVGPVRAGKSTLIKKFMEALVLPRIEDPFDRDRARDELPQSAGGKTVMTTEPKFVPDEAIPITVGQGIDLKVRMIDCVGYLVDGALGSMEGESERMVHTPWSDAPMPFSVAAEYGTKKVISDHSTIGIVVTSDGTVTDLPRSAYIEPEERVVSELKALGKPFLVLLNSADPASPRAMALGRELEEKYDAPLALVNCLDLSGEDIEQILSLILAEFPARSLKVSLPHWFSALPAEHPLRLTIKTCLLDCAKGISKVGQLSHAFDRLLELDQVASVSPVKVDMGIGTASLSVDLAPQVYYEVLSEIADCKIENEGDLCAVLGNLASLRSRYERVAKALDDLDATGYGIVTPTLDEMRLEEPEIIRQSGGYGVKLKASGPSIHLIRAGIETEISPIVGTEEQSEDLVRFLLKEFDDEPAKLWQTELFGKRLSDLVTEGLHAKLAHIPEDARQKLSETLARIVNEGSGGLICILL